MLVFAGLLTRYTTRRGRISSSLAYQYSQAYLRTTPQNQQQPRISVFAGLLTRYTTRRGKISSILACQYSQVYLHPTPPDAVELAAALHVSIRRPTYFLQSSMLVQHSKYTTGIFTLYIYSVSYKIIMPSYC